MPQGWRINATSIGVSDGREAEIFCSHGLVHQLFVNMSWEEDIGVGKFGGCFLD